MVERKRTILSMPEKKLAALSMEAERRMMTRNALINLVLDDYLAKTGRRAALTCGYVPGTKRDTSEVKRG